MFCGKKNPKLEIDSKVASDDSSNLKINLGGFHFAIDKNFGLKPSFGQEIEKLPQTEFLKENEIEISDLQSKKYLFEENVQERQNERDQIKKRLLVKKLKYEKLKSKLISVLQEYEIKSQKLSNLNKINNF